MAAALGIQILGNLPSVTARNNAKTAPLKIDPARILSTSSGPQAHADSLWSRIVMGLWFSRGERWMTCSTNS
jgi:hypothetical protein